MKIVMNDRKFEVQRIEVTQRLLEAAAVKFVVAAVGVEPDRVAEAWVDAPVKVVAGDGQEEELRNLIGTGWELETQEEGANLQILRGLIARVLTRDHLEWLRARHEKLLVYQRGGEDETAQKCLDRFWGGRLGAALPGFRVLALDQYLPRGCCFARPPGWSNATFVDELARYLSSMDGRVVGWVPTASKAALLVAGQRPSIVLRSGESTSSRVVESTGVVSGHESFQVSYQTVVSSSHWEWLSEFGACEEAVLETDGLPRLPGNVRYCGQDTFCRAFRLTTVGADLSSQEVRVDLELGQIPNSPRDRFREVLVPGAFKEWKEQAWAAAEPGEGLDWAVYESWKAHRIDGDELLVRLQAMGRSSQDGFHGLAIKQHKGDRLPIALVPGQAPRVMGVPAAEADVGDTSEATLTTEEGTIAIASEELTVNDNLSVSSEKSVFQNEVSIKDVDIG